MHSRTTTRLAPAVADQPRRECCGCPGTTRRNMSREPWPDHPDRIESVVAAGRLPPRRLPHRCAFIRCLPEPRCQRLVMCPNRVLHQLREADRRTFDFPPSRPSSELRNRRNVSSGWICGYLLMLALLLRGLVVLAPDLGQIDGRLWEPHV